MVDRVLIGVVVGVQGVRGVLRVKSHAAIPAAIAAYGPVEDPAGARRWSLCVVGESRGAVLVKASGVTSRDQAEALVGTELFVPRAALPAPAEDEFYHADLVGLEAVDEGGAALGWVVALHDFGAGPVIEIGEMLLPFTMAVVPVVDLAARRLVVRLPGETKAEAGDAAA